MKKIILSLLIIFSGCNETYVKPIYSIKIDDVIYTNCTLYYGNLHDIHFGETGVNTINFYHEGKLKIIQGKNIEVGQTN